VDENLDGFVDEKEFELMYKRCIEDDTGLEPKTLFNLVQFLMFSVADTSSSKGESDSSNEQPKFKREITAEDTYFLIYGRIDRQEHRYQDKGEKRDQLEKEIKIIFA
jgi:hypothetical protein